MMPITVIGKFALTSGLRTTPSSVGRQQFSWIFRPSRFGCWGSEVGYARGKHCTSGRERVAKPLQASATVAAPPTEMIEAAEQTASAPKPIYRKDYKAPDYIIPKVDLLFRLQEDVTTVRTKLSVEPNYQKNGSAPALILDGKPDVKLVELKVDGSVVPASDYSITDKGKLVLSSVPHQPFELETIVEIKPQDNTSLEGLYKSGGNFCTQCEAEGFSNITYFLDRPDVMSVYTTRIEADKATYPVLLSNGNCKESGDLEGGRHYAVWEDPFKKPCYLFALVAGDLACKEEVFVTKSNREVKLRIFVKPKDLEKVDFAMLSLKNSMKWDEVTFGLEYDLDLFNIVAVDDFNMGAMENKSLNIFNSRLVLASPKTATDMDYKRIEGVVAHEYFHNWTGNRVTCRDWFQLTLKEGLTVYRDSEFSADMNSQGLKRIEDVAALRASQFPEDAGTMAHPIRPESYIKMDNFYTMTVYEKGSEVVRLYETLLGKAGFRKGMDLYFERHDGQAVTCDDFRQAMADANGVDLADFDKWYSQAGTPQLVIKTEYSPASRTYTIQASQSTPPSPGQPTKEPVPIPIAVGLLRASGQELPLRLQGDGADLGTSTVLLLKEAEQTFVFTEVDEEPVPSLLRGFSAPVKMTVEGQTEEQLAFLLGHDTDSFNRWEAGQRLLGKLVTRLYNHAIQPSKGASVEDRCRSSEGVPDSLVEALRAVLLDTSLDGAFVSAVLSLPSANEMVDSINECDPVTLHYVRKYVLRELAQRLRPDLEAAVKRCEAPPGEDFSPTFSQYARRCLKNKALALLGELGDPEITSDLLSRFRRAANMTDKVAALTALLDVAGPEREAALAEFYEEWKEEPLVVLKWLQMVASSALPGNVADVTKLLEHPAFIITNPNSCYSVFLGFARSPVNFHAADGSGYDFMADSILKVDKINPQVAARMTSAFTQYANFDKPRQDLMQKALRRLADTKGLSENVFEIVSKSVSA